MKTMILLLAVLTLSGCADASAPPLTASGTLLLGSPAYVVERERIIALLKVHGADMPLADLRAQVTTGEFPLASCHAIAHELGHAAYEYYGDVGTALEHRDSVCNAGYIHGVIERALLGSADLEGDLADLCMGYETGSLIRNSCEHGAGHGVMYWSDNDLEKSLAFCHAVGTGSSLHNCRNGVFMELFNVDGKTHVSRLLKSNDPFYPCPALEAELQPFCYLYAPKYYLSLHARDYAGALQWCASAEGMYPIVCAKGIGGLAMNDHLHNVAPVEALCMDAPNSEMRKQCLIGMVRMHIDTVDDAAEGPMICGRMQRENRKLCRETVFEYDPRFPG